MEYFYIPQYYSHLRLGRSAVLIHKHDVTNEASAYYAGANVDRIPHDYQIVTKGIRDRRKSLCIKKTDSHLKRLLLKAGFLQCGTKTKLVQTSLEEVLQKKRINYEKN